MPDVTWTPSTKDSDMTGEDAKRKDPRKELSDERVHTRNHAVESRRAWDAEVREKRERHDE